MSSTTDVVGSSLAGESGADSSAGSSATLAIFAGLGDRDFEHGSLNIKFNY